MLKMLPQNTSRSLIGFGSRVLRRMQPVQAFHSHHYLRHTARRLEHLASLGIPVAGMRVLEVGAGIGDHSHYYLDRGCELTITEARPESIRQIARRYPGCTVRILDMDAPGELPGGPFDVVHCYGLLYHLGHPERAMEFLARCTGRMLFLETCVSFGDGDDVNLVEELDFDPTQARSGTGCRPTRSWIFRRLQAAFPHVYVPVTQPCHEQFPLDWSTPASHGQSLQRAVFIASRHPIDNPLLAPRLIDRHTRAA